jgi:proteic killer suppression protein
MIRTFSDKGLENFFLSGTLKGIQPKHANRLELLLERLNAAADIKDMKFPGSKLHKLEPKQKGVWSVYVAKNYSLTFKFEGGDAFEVQCLDYH